MGNWPERRSIRLPGWDYRTPGYYFITICTAERRTLFADERLAEIAEYAWRIIPTQPHAHGIAVDEFVVMPNHLHGILQICGDLDTFAAQDAPKGRLVSGSIGAMIGNYKSLVTRRIRRVQRVGPGYRVWQRGYWDRIIRNERELQATREYIRLNPQRWAEDNDNLEVLLSRMVHRADRHGRT